MGRGRRADEFRRRYRHTDTHPQPRDTAQRTITVVLPALNEEAELERSVRTTVAALRDWFADWELLLYDDGSTDRTGEIADRLAAEIDGVEAFHHAAPQSIGGVLRRGLERARMRHFMWVDGKGATPRAALDRIFSHCGEADLVVPYAANQHERTLLRRLISRAFCAVLNCVFRLDLRQYTHLVLCETEAARRVAVRTNSYAYQAEVLIKMIKSGSTYVQVGVEDDFSREAEHSKAFRLANVLGVAGFFFHVLWDVYGPDARRLRRP